MLTSNWRRITAWSLTERICEEGGGRKKREWWKRWDVQNQARLSLPIRYEWVTVFFRWTPPLLVETAAMARVHSFAPSSTWRNSCTKCFGSCKIVSRRVKNDRIDLATRTQTTTCARLFSAFDGSIFVSLFIESWGIRSSNFLVYS